MSVENWRDHVLLIGPPGAGKTLWARLQSEKVPYAEWAKRDTDSEWFFRVAGLSDRWMEMRKNPDARPFRAPHHTVSESGLCGTSFKGYRLRPGELSLAHGGVFFVDEATEWRRDALEAIVRATRAQSVAIGFGQGETRCMLNVPAEFRLIAASSGCPCGYRGHLRETCRCSDESVRHHLARLEPLMRVCRVLPFEEWRGEVVPRFMGVVEK